MSAQAIDFDVVIVGAGIAGAALAVALQDSGLRIALLEARPMRAAPTAPADDLPQGPAQFDARVSALTPRSMALLQSLGVWEAICQQRSCAYSHMSVWDAEGTGGIEFDSAELDCDALGYIVENRVIISALLQRSAEAKAVTVFNPARLMACERDLAGLMHMSLEDGRQLQASLVVAADGATSPLRDMLGFATREWDYGHRALVATVELQCSHSATARQRFLSSGPLALLPLPEVDGRHYCSIVWSLDEAEAEPILALNDAQFCRRLALAAEHCLGEVLATSPRFAFPLRQRHAIDYVKEGVALVGDAAHSIHPLAGQGINLGLSDVAVLAEELRGAQKGGEAPGDLVLLRRYQRRRKSENLLMMAAMDGFKRLFEQRSPALRWLRNAGMRGVGRSGLLKRQIMRQAMGLEA